MVVKKKKVMDEGEVFDPIPTPPKMVSREDAIPPAKPLVKPAVSIPPEKENPYYIKTLWHGVKEVYQCKKCGVFRDGSQEDSMILHVIIHVPHAEQNALLDELTKEYKK